MYSQNVSSPSLLAQPIMFHERILRLLVPSSAWLHCGGQIVISSPSVSIITQPFLGCIRCCSSWGWVTELSKLPVVSDVIQFAVAFGGSESKTIRSISGSLNVALPLGGASPGDGWSVSSGDGEWWVSGSATGLIEEPIFDTDGLGRVSLCNWSLNSRHPGGCFGQMHRPKPSLLALEIVPWIYDECPPTGSALIDWNQSGCTTVKVFVL